MKFLLMRSIATPLIKQAAQNQWQQFTGMIVHSAIQETLLTTCHESSIFERGQGGNRSWATIIYPILMLLKPRASIFFAKRRQNFPALLSCIPSAKILLSCFAWPKK